MTARMPSDRDPKSRVYRLSIPKRDIAALNRAARMYRRPLGGLLSDIVIAHARRSMPDMLTPYVCYLDPTNERDPQ